MAENKWIKWGTWVSDSTKSAYCLHGDDSFLGKGKHPWMTRTLLPDKKWRQPWEFLKTSLFSIDSSSAIAQWLGSGTKHRRNWLPNLSFAFKRCGWKKFQTSSPLNGDWNIVIYHGMKYKFSSNKNASKQVLKHPMLNLRCADQNLGR